MISKDDIIQRTKEEIARYKATEGTLTVRRTDPERDGFDYFGLGLDYPGRHGLALECPRDFDRLLLAYFRENPGVSGIVLTIKTNKATMKVMGRAAVIRRDEALEDARELHQMQRLNTTMYTGRPGEADYDPNSTTPCVSDTELRQFKHELKKKRHTPRAQPS